MFRRIRHHETENDEGKRHGDEPAKPVAIGHDGCALVIVVRQLGRDRRPRHEKDRQGHPRQHHEAGQPCKQLHVRKTIRRREHEIEEHTERHGSNQHQRMPAPPLRMQVVRHRPDPRIGNRIDDDRQAQRQRHQQRINPQDLAVVKQDKGLEHPVLDRVRKRPDPLRQLHPNRKPPHALRPRIGRKGPITNCHQNHP